MEAGGGVLDKPTTSPGRSSEFDLDTVKKRRRSPNYRVLLHNDDVNRRDYVVKVLLKVIDGMAPDQAVNIMNHAHVYGMATVVVCGQGKRGQHRRSLSLSLSPMSVHSAHRRRGGVLFMARLGGDILRPAAVQRAHFHDRAGF